MSVCLSGSLSDCRLSVLAVSVSLSFPPLDSCSSSFLSLFYRSLTSFLFHTVMLIIYDMVNHDVSDLLMTLWAPLRSFHDSPFSYILFDGVIKSTVYFPPTDYIKDNYLWCFWLYFAFFFGAVDVYRDLKYMRLICFFTSLLLVSVGTYSYVLFDFVMYAYTSAHLHVSYTCITRSSSSLKWNIRLGER